MAIKLTWFGHGCWLIETAEHKLLLDPFLNDSPTAPIKAEEVSPDFILVSHGHFDHVADVETIAKASDALVIAIFEVAQWFGIKGLGNTLGMNIGGSTKQPFGKLTMTQALHSSSLPDGSYGGEPAGFVLEAEGKRIYFACDTGLFSDMQLIGKSGLDLAVLPIGDLFTMGPHDSLAATKLLKPKQVLPAHYNTWPPIEQDAAEWANLIRGGSDAEPIVLNPGATHQL